MVVLEFPGVAPAVVPVRVQVVDPVAEVPEADQEAARQGYHQTFQSFPLAVLLRLDSQQVGAECHRVVVDFHPVDQEVLEVRAHLEGQA